MMIDPKIDPERMEQWEANILPVQSAERLKGKGSPPSACPFCGAKAKHDEEETYSLDSSYEYIGCTKCPAQIPIWSTKEEAVKQWNLRANAQAQVPLSQT